MSTYLDTLHRAGDPAGAAEAAAADAKARVLAHYQREAAQAPQWAGMSSEERRQMLVTMRQYGGSFVCALADAWVKADAAHADVLGRAFPALVTRYGPGSAMFSAVVEARS